MTTSMIKPMGYLFLRWRLVVALIVGILIAMVMVLFAYSEQPAAQTTRPGQQIIAAGNVHSMALKKDGTVWAWGLDGWGELGNGGPAVPDWVQDTPVQVQGLTGVVDIDVGDNHSMALRSDGTVWAWGRNNYGQLGVGDTSNRISPVKVHGGQQGTQYLTDIVNVEAGDNYSFAVDQGGKVWAWGGNAEGQLGDGSTSERYTPVPVSSGMFTGVGELAGGYHHSLALKDGKVWSWGGNAYGQLGTNDTTDYRGPVQVSTDSGLTGVVTDVDAGLHHSLALEDSGKMVWSWGGNTYGQLGDDTGQKQLAPVRVSSRTGLFIPQQWDSSGVVEDVAAGKYHSLAVKDDGTAWAWGSNWNGQLGRGSHFDEAHEPNQVDAGSGLYNGGGVTNVDAGDYHSLAVKSDGTVWAWGNNDDGQLGDATGHERNSPVQVHGPNDVGFLTDIGAPADPLPPGAENPPSDAKSDVIAMEPAPGETGVLRRTPVTATFSEKMDPNTLTKENFRLYEISANNRPVQITNVSVTPEAEGEGVTLDHRPLRKDTEYVAVVTTGVKHLDDGNAMAAPEFWRFETGRQM